MARDLLQRQPGLYAQGYYSLAYGVPLADTAAACVIPASASLAFGVWQYAKRSGRLKNIADLFKSKDHLRFYIQGDENALEGVFIYESRRALDGIKHLPSPANIKKARLFASDGIL